MRFNALNPSATPVKLVLFEGLSLPLYFSFRGSYSTLIRTDLVKMPSKWSTLVSLPSLRAACEPAALVSLLSLCSEQPVSRGRE